MLIWAGGLTTVTVFFFCTLSILRPCSEKHLNLALDTASSLFSAAWGVFFYDKRTPDFIWGSFVLLFTIINQLLAWNRTRLMCCVGEKKNKTKQKKQRKARKFHFLCVWVDKENVFSHKEKNKKWFIMQKEALLLLEQSLLTFRALFCPLIVIQFSVILVDTMNGERTRIEHGHEAVVLCSRAIS